MSLSPEDIDRIAEAVAAKLAAARRPTPTVLLTKDELAGCWKVSTATIDRMVRQGMPFELVTADAKRFDEGACTCWRRQNVRALHAPPPAAPLFAAEEDMTGVRLASRGGK